MLLSTPTGNYSSNTSKPCAITTQTLFLQSGPSPPTTFNKEEYSHDKLVARLCSYDNNVMCKLKASELGGRCT